MNICRKCVSVTLAILTVMTVMLVGIVPGTVKVEAASWNGYNYGGGKLYGSQSFLEAFGIDYNVYMKWMDDHDKDSANPNYYLGTPYAHNDHRNPRGDCKGARGAYDTPGVAALNCTGFVWHVLYKSAVNSGASRTQINRMQVMGGVPASWVNLGIKRIWFDSIEDAYNSGVLEKGDLMWIYGTSDNHNAIYYGDSPEDFIYWDSAGKNNRYAKVHSIGGCRGLWVAKVAQPNKIELSIDTPPVEGAKFGTKYMVFDSKEKAQNALNAPHSDPAWDKRLGTIVLDKNGHGCLREGSAPSASELWSGDTPLTNHSYFNANGRRVDSKKTYYAVQWTHADGISEDKTIHEFKDSGMRTGKGYRKFRFYVPVTVDAPEITSLKSTSDGVKIKWNAVKGAQKYRIYYKNKNGNWVKMKDLASTSYVDTDVKSGTNYTYTIRCITNDGDFISDYDTSGWKLKYTCLDTPKVTGTNSTADGVEIKWNAVEGEDVRYRVYYKNSKGNWTKMTETTDTVYTDKDVKLNTSYTYTVRCVDKAGDFTSLFNKTGWKYTFKGVSTPKITSISSEAQGVRMSWDAAKGSNARYRIYYKNSKGSWVRLTETKETSFLDDTIGLNTSRTYTVRVVNSMGNFTSDFNKSGWSCKYTGAATPDNITLENTSEGVVIRWNAVEGVPQYRVFYQSGGSWTRLGLTEGTEMLDTHVTDGESYTYTVRCVSSREQYISDYNRSGVTIKYEKPEVPTETKIPETFNSTEVTDHTEVPDSTESMETPNE